MNDAAPVRASGGWRVRAMGGASLVVVSALLFASGSGYAMQIAITTLLFVMLTASLNFVTGTAGLMTLGHAAFYGVGAYSAALLATKLDWPFWATLPAAGATACVGGILVALPTMRLTSIYFAVATLGIGEMIVVAIVNWVGLTRGPMGIRGIPPLTLGGHDGLSVNLAVTGAVALAMLWALSRLTHSYYGNALRALREDDACAEAMGVPTVRLKIESFAIACFCAGVAGALHAHTSGYISPDSFRFAESILILSMAVVGGLGSLPGAALGAAILIVLPELLRGFGNLRMVAVGVILFTCILFLPKGLLGEVPALEFFRRQLAGKRTGW
jgi:branched-chain amino acid transport system permease protein